MERNPGESAPKTKVVQNFIYRVYTAIYTGVFRAKKQNTVPGKRDTGRAQCNREYRSAIHSEYPAVRESLCSIGKNSRVEMSDLLQEAFLALIRAIDKYNPDKGVKFMTYATWEIKQAARRYSFYNGRSLRLPAHITTDIQKYKRYALSHPDEKGTAKALGWTQEKLNTIQRLSSRCLSLDEPLPGEDSKTLGEITPDGQQDYDRIEEAEDSFIIWGVVNELPINQKAVIICRYYKGLTTRQTGEALGISDQCVSQTEKRALKALGHNDIIRAFKSFYTSPKKIKYDNYYGSGYGSFKTNQASSVELLLEAWARDGLTDEQLAQKMNIGTRTLYEWKQKHPQISQALKRGKDGTITNRY